MPFALLSHLGALYWDIGDSGLPYNMDLAQFKVSLSYHASGNAQDTFVERGWLR